MEIGILNTIHAMKALLVSNIDIMVSVSQGNLYHSTNNLAKTIITDVFFPSDMWKEREASTNYQDFTYSKNRDGELL